MSSSRQFHCPLCGGDFQVDASMRGTRVLCPHCREETQIPELEPPLAPPPPPGADREDGAPAPPPPATDGQAPQSATLDRRQAVHARDQRNSLKNAILWTVCTLLMLVVVWYLVR